MKLLLNVRSIVHNLFGGTIPGLLPQAVGNKRAGSLRCYISSSLKLACENPSFHHRSFLKQARMEIGWPPCCMLNYYSAKRFEPGGGGVWGENRLDGKAWRRDGLRYGGRTEAETVWVRNGEHADHKAPVIPMWYFGLQKGTWWRIGLSSCCGRERHRKDPNNLYWKKKSGTFRTRYRCW